MPVTLGYHCTPQVFQASILQYLNARNRLQNALVPCANTLGTVTHSEYKIWIVAEQKKMPGQRGVLPPGNIGRIRVYWHNNSIPTNERPVRGYVFFSVNTFGEWESGTVNQKIKDIINMYGRYLVIEQEIPAETMSDAEATIEEVRALTRKLERAKALEASKETYGTLTRALEAIGIQIESALENEYVNITLPNNLKVKVAVDGGIVVVKDAEINMAFTTTDGILETYLKKLASV